MLTLVRRSGMSRDGVSAGSRRDSKLEYGVSRASVRCFRVTAGAAQGLCPDGPRGVHARGRWGSGGGVQAGLGPITCCSECRLTQGGWEQRTEH